MPTHCEGAPSRVTLKDTAPADVAADALKAFDEIKKTSRWFFTEEVDDLEKRYEELYSKEDPEDNPYLSKYAARELLEGYIKKLEGWRISESDPDEKIQDRSVDILEVDD